MPRYFLDLSLAEAEVVRLRNPGYSIGYNAQQILEEWVLEHDKLKAEIDNDRASVVNKRLSIIEEALETAGILEKTS